MKQRAQGAVTLAIEDDVDEILARLAHAMRTDDPADACAGLLETARAGCASLRTLPAREAWRRVGEVAGVLGVPGSAPGDPDEAAGLTPPGGYRVPRPAAEGPLAGSAAPWLPGPQGRLPIQDELLALAGELGELGESLDLLRELAHSRVPSDQGGVRFFVALARALDQLLWEVRYRAREPELAARLRPLQRTAIERARSLGAQVYPGPGQRRLDARAPCPVRELPAFGAEPGAIQWVDRHGFVLPGGRVEEAVVRVVQAAAPAWLDLLLEGYRALLVRGAAGATSPATYRAWLDELPALGDRERQATTVRYAATAVFGLAQDAPGARALYERFAQALEELGSFPIPLEPQRLHDEERYDVLLQHGVGAPRLTRPGFQGADGLVQQRARVVADPRQLGSGG